MNQFFVEKTGKNQAQQIHGDRRDRALGGQILAIEMIDASHASI